MLKAMFLNTNEAYLNKIVDLIFFSMFQIQRSPKFAKKVKKILSRPKSGNILQLKLK